MQEITTLTNNPIQRHQLVLENNETVDFKLYYEARVQGWYFDFSYKDLTVNGLKVVLSPNILRNFKRLIPFGLSFSAQNDIQPFWLNDFSSNRVKMYVLNSEEVEQIEEEVFNE